MRKLTYVILLALLWISSFHGVVFKGKASFRGDKHVFYNRVIPDTSSTPTTGLFSRLVAYYKLDVDSVSLYDDAIGSNDFSIETGTFAAINSGTGILGKSYFPSNASGDSLWLKATETDSLDINGEQSFSVLLWMKYATGNMPEYEGLVTKWNGDGAREWMLYFSSAQNLYFMVSSDGGTPYSSATWQVLPAPGDDTWFHVGGVYDADKDSIFLYYNGSIVDREAHSGGIYNGSQPVRIGRFVANDGANYGGEVEGCYFDELMIYRRALTSSEVDSIYNSGNGLNFVY